VAGAQLLRLFGPLQVGLVGEVLPHRLTAMAVDHVDRRRLQLAGRIDHVRQHRLAGDRLQHLRQHRLHALAAPAARMMTCRVGSWERQSVVRCR
jgi:hypothetical protein